MNNIYTSGEYYRTTNGLWHAEDAPWKAHHILKLLQDHCLKPASVLEIGCGSGQILNELAQASYMAHCTFTGYDISLQAIELCNNINNSRCEYYHGDPPATSPTYYDVLLAIDVMEHVPDYIGFIESCKLRATYKIFHIPLDINVSSALRDKVSKSRYSVGHLHYFTAQSALETLIDAGYKILNARYTAGALGVANLHPTWKSRVANVCRLTVNVVSSAISARLFGGYSLLVLAQ